MKTILFHFLKFLRKGSEKRRKEGRTLPLINRYPKIMMLEIRNVVDELFFKNKETYICIYSFRVQKMVLRFFMHQQRS